MRTRDCLVGVAMIVVLGAGCSSVDTESYTPRVEVTTPSQSAGDQGSRGAAAVAVLAPDLTGTGPGSVVEATELKAGSISSAIIDTGARGMRVVYRSTSATGNETVVSGVVFVPAGTPPTGGWPVIAYGHGQTGIRNECGPSLHADLLGYDVQVTSLLLGGYIVAMPDYEGLGSAGVFPMFEPKTLGANMIDAVRAAHRITPEASDRWASFGGAIGGSAAWSANEMAATYAPEYELTGTVALVPPADVAPMALAAADGSLTSAQRYQYLLEVASLKRTSHPELTVEDYLSGATLANLDVLTACFGAEADRAAKLVPTLPVSDTVPVSPAAADRMYGWLGERALPMTKLSAPMLLIYTTDNSVVRQAWTDGAVQRSCALGSTIEVVLRDGQSEDNVDASPALPWIRDAIDGSRQTGNTCT